MQKGGTSKHLREALEINGRNPILRKHDEQKTATMDITMYPKKYETMASEARISIPRTQVYAQKTPMS